MLDGAVSIGVSLKVRQELIRLVAPPLIVDARLDLLSHGKAGTGLGAGIHAEARVVAIGASSPAKGSIAVGTGETGVHGYLVNLDAEFVPEILLKE
jgi:hypothetical protein